MGTLIKSRLKVGSVRAEFSYGGGFPVTIEKGIENIIIDKRGILKPSYDLFLIKKNLLIRCDFASKLESTKCIAIPIERFQRTNDYQIPSIPNTRIIL